MITASLVELLHPLPALYALAGRELPEFDLIESGELPPVAYRLLAHSGDMTSKLEEFYADRMRLRLLQCDHRPDHYRREVALFCEQSGMPVEYGAIEIHLEAFDDQLRAEIVSAQLPLGGLLNRYGIRYRSEPRAFWRVRACLRMAELFQMSEPGVLYGRSNYLLDGEGSELATIVEILRPI